MYPSARKCSLRGTIAASSAEKCADSEVAEQTLLEPGGCDIYQTQRDDTVRVQMQSNVLLALTGLCASDCVSVNKGGW